MKKLFRYAGLTAVLLAAPAIAQAGELKLTIVDGRVTLVANDVTVREILAEWARIGQTKIINGEKVIGPPLTLVLEDVPEAQALETVLRSAAGYVAAPRMNGITGPSNFDSISILATSRAPAVTPVAPTPFVNRPTPQPMMPQVAVGEDDDEAEADETGPGPGPGPVGAQFPGPTRPQFPNVPGQPGQQPVIATPQGPMTLPRPGQLPQQPQTPGMNPYVPGQATPQRPNPGGVPRPGGGSGGEM